MFRKRMSIAAVVVVTALSLTACGGTSKDAADKSTDSPSSASTDSGSGSDSGSGYTPLTKDNFASAIADSYKQKSSAHMEMTMGDTVKASGDVSYADKSPGMKLAMTVSQSGQKLQIEEILVDGVLYMSSPGLTPSGKYVKIDSKTPGVGSMSDLLKNVDPASMIGQMTKSLDKLEYAGTTKIDGNSTHHYKMTVDAKKAVSSLGLSDLPSSAATAIPDSITYDAYFNDDNTIRRITMDIMGQSMQMDMTDWGTPVTITAPKKSDVVDLGSMMPSMPAKP